VQNALKPELPAKPEALKEARLLLRTHGKELCKDKGHLCHQCPVSAECSYAKITAASFIRSAI